MNGLPLVTGATGFAGSHLVERLTADGPIEAWSNPSGRQPTVDRRDGRIHWRAVDLDDRDAVNAAIADGRPSVVYHCAAAADVQASWRDPARTLRINVVGTYHLLDALSRLDPAPPVVLPSSALVYRASDTALTEDAAVAPANPYGWSKLAQELVARASGVPLVIARAFNHAGPRQDASYAASSFARQLAVIEARGQPGTINVGNLDARRDLTDVRDTVRAYRLLADRPRPHDLYNVCSGLAWRVRDVLDHLATRIRVPIEIVVDADRLRPNDVPIVVGDHGRLTRDTGWEPEISIEQTLDDLLDYWRAVVRSPSPRPA